MLTGILQLNTLRLTAETNQITYKCALIFSLEYSGHVSASGCRYRCKTVWCYSIKVR